MWDVPVLGKDDEDRFEDPETMERTLWEDPTSGQPRTSNNGNNSRTTADGASKGRVASGEGGGAADLMIVGGSPPEEAAVQEPDALMRERSTLKKDLDPAPARASTLKAELQPSPPPPPTYKGEPSYCMIRRAIKAGLP